MLSGDCLDEPSLWCTDWCRLGPGDAFSKVSWSRGTNSDLCNFFRSRGNVVSMLRVPALALCQVCSWDTFLRQHRSWALKNRIKSWRGEQGRRRQSQVVPWLWCAWAAAPNQYRARRGLVLITGWWCSWKWCYGCNISAAGRRGTLARMQIRKVNENWVEAAIAEVQLYWCWGIKCKFWDIWCIL